jgi:hypothetical protein
MRPGQTFQERITVANDSPEPNSFDLLASYVQVHLPFPRYDKTQSWWSPLLHKWLNVVHITALLAELKDRPQSPEAGILKRCGKFTVMDGLRYIKEEIVPVDRVAAQGPLNEFSQFSLEYAMF